MFAVYKKELRSYFTNAIGYVYAGIFLALSAAACCYTTLKSNSYSTSFYFTLMIYAFIILVPLLTMRLFSEEKKTKTEQLLLTAPITITGMVAGKYFAALTLFVGTVVASCINFIPLYIVCSAERAADDGSALIDGPNTAHIFGSVIGIILIGAAFIAIGMFISSLTENQLSAAVITISALLAMLILNFIISAGEDSEGTRLVGSYIVRAALGFFSLFTRFTRFGYGIFDFSALLYYVSIAGIFFYLTVRIFEKRRWS